MATISRAERIGGGRVVREAAGAVRARRGRRLENRIAVRALLPVIWGDRIFLTAAEPGQRKPAPLGKMIDVGGKLFTICLDRPTGKILWKREAPRPRVEPYQSTNSPASPSPVTDGKRVYVFFGDFGLLAYGFDGAESWRLPLGPFNNTNGHGTSPILVDNLLVLLCDQDTGSYLLAVDKETGRVKWKAERPNVTRSYSTPAVLRPARGAVEVIVPGSHELAGYDAGTGEKLWWIHGMSWQPKSTPVIDGEMIYAHWWETGGEAEAPAQTATFAEMLAKYDTNHDGKLRPRNLRRNRAYRRDCPTAISAGTGISTSAIGTPTARAGPRGTRCWRSAMAAAAT